MNTFDSEDGLVINVFIPELGTEQYALYGLNECINQGKWFDELRNYSTVTLFARFLGLSTSNPLAMPM